jgi:hypothetical protein
MQSDKKISDEEKKYRKFVYQIMDKLEQRISTLEKVIGKLQLRLGDVVLYIDKKEEQS